MSVPVDLVRVVGPDAETYLQGQLSQDVAAMTPGDERWSFVLAPNGHIDGFVRVLRDGDDAFALTVEAGYGEQVHARLNRFLLRTKAEVTLEPAADPAVAPEDEMARIEAGLPSMAREIDERTVPAETGWVAEAVSFTKGCYTGQELVARMDSRVAEPPRRLVRMRAASPIKAGAVIVVDGAEVGAVTSAADVVALGYVKRGAPQSGDAQVDGVPVTLLGPVGA